MIRLKCDDCGVKYKVQPSYTELEFKCEYCKEIMRIPHRQENHTDEGKADKPKYSIFDHSPYWWIMPVIIFVVCSGGGLLLLSFVHRLYLIKILYIFLLSAFCGVLYTAIEYFTLSSKHRCRDCKTFWAAETIITWRAVGDISGFVFSKMKCRKCGAVFTHEKELTE